MLNVRYSALILALVMEITSLEGIDAKSWNSSILKPYFRQLHRENGWRVFAEGQNNYNEKPVITVFCWAPQRFSIEEARRSFVEESQKIINVFNRKRSRNQGYFTIENLGLSVNFVNECYQNFEAPFVASVSSVAGHILYRALATGSGELEVVYEEPYQEAVRIVQEENQCEYGDF